LKKEPMLKSWLPHRKLPLRHNKAFIQFQIPLSFAGKGIFFMNYFFSDSIQDGVVLFKEEEAKHMVRVLRKQVGQEIGVLDGKGGKHLATITQTSKSEVQAKVTSSQTIEEHEENPGLILAIAPTKNMDRIEFLVEKAVEMGIKEFALMECSNSERRKVNVERLEKKMVAAFKQSGQTWLPSILDLTPFKSILKQYEAMDTKLICCCPEDLPRTSIHLLPKRKDKALVLVGPEGDFSKEEIQLALDNGFEAVSLGPSRLRTETAGLLISSHFYIQHI